MGCDFKRQRIVKNNRGRKSGQADYGPVKWTHVKRYLELHSYSSLLPEVVAEGMSNPTIYNNLLQQTGQFFIEKVWGFPGGSQ